MRSPSCAGYVFLCVAASQPTTVDAPRLFVDLYLRLCGLKRRGRAIAESRLCGSPHYTFVLLAIQAICCRAVLDRFSLVHKPMLPPPIPALCDPVRAYFITPDFRCISFVMTAAQTHPLLALLVIDARVPVRSLNRLA